MKNHKINYKKYITLVSILAMTMVGAATVSENVNNITMYDVVDDSGKILYHTDDGVDLDNPNIIDELDDFENENVPFNTGYTAYPYEVSGNTAKSIAVAEKELAEGVYNIKSIPKENLELKNKETIKTDDGQIDFEEYLATDTWNLGTLKSDETSYSGSSKEDSTLIETLQINLDIEGSFEKGETYTYQLTEETFNKLPNKHFSLPKTEETVRRYNSIDGDGNYTNNNKATLTLDNKGLLTITFEENSWFGSYWTEDLSVQHFVLPFIATEAVADETTNIQIPLTTGSYTTMKDLPALYVYNLVKSEIPYHAFNINGQTNNTFEHEIELIENNLNRNEIGNYTQIYEVTTINGEKGLKTLEIEVIASTEDEVPETETPEPEAPEPEAPEVEAPEPEAPEVEAPETEAPEVEEPEAPEVEVPETPEAPEVEPEAPEVVETEAPEAPEKEDEKDTTEAPIDPKKVEENVDKQVENVKPNVEKEDETEVAAETSEAPNDLKKEVEKAKKDSPDTLLQTDIASLNPLASGITGLIAVISGLYGFNYFKKRK